MLLATQSSCTFVHAFIDPQWSTKWQLLQQHNIDMKHPAFPLLVPASSVKPPKQRKQNKSSDSSSKNRTESSSFSSSSSSNPPSPFSNHVLNPQLLAVLRIQRMLPEEVKFCENAFGDRMISRSNEEVSLYIFQGATGLLSCPSPQTTLLSLKEACRYMLSEYFTTLAQDEQLLKTDIKDSKLSMTMKFILYLRIGEKRIINRAMELIQQKLDKL